MSDNMYDLSGWQAVPCVVADVLRASVYTSPGSSLTDPDGQYGQPVVYTEWYMDDQPVLREYRWTDERPCEHYVPLRDRGRG